MKCWGICGGDPRWRDPATGLCCVLCGGSGKLADPPTFGQKCEEIAAKARLSHSAIVAGDADVRAGKPRPVKWGKRRRPRMTKARRRELAMMERQKSDASAFAQFRASRPEDWDKQLDDLKAEFRGKR